MNEQQIAYRIKQLLNRGLDLDAGKLARLKESRERALACQHVESRVPVLAWAGNAINFALIGAAWAVADMIARFGPQSRPRPPA